MRHDRRAFVGGRVGVSDDADVEAVAEGEGVSEEGLVSDVAEVVYSVAVDVFADGEEGHVEVGAEVGEDGDVVDCDEG